MQRSFRLSSTRSKLALFFAGASIPCLFSASLHCDPYASAWALGSKSGVRLIATPGRGAASYRAGVEIKLEPGAITYWRTPGEAGAPPEFSFEGSENVAEAAVSYPVPERIDEDGTEAFGYRGGVVFPLRVEAKDPARPVILKAAISYAVCQRICLPAKAEASLTLSPDPLLQRAAPGEAAEIASAEALVPVRLTAEEEGEKLKVAREERAARPAWRVSVVDGKAEDVFAEAPPGWYFETRKAESPNEFLLTLAGKPAGSGPLPPVTLTVKRKDRSFEAAVSLDPSRPLR
jgi:DsbC/DsbD-like thiol-disulfide interchange protein